jgi:hypothetical protein
MALSMCIKYDIWSKYILNIIFEFTEISLFNFPLKTLKFSLFYLKLVQKCWVITVNAQFFAKIDITSSEPRMMDSLTK